MIRRNSQQVKMETVSSGMQFCSRKSCSTEAGNRKNFYGDTYRYINRRNSNVDDERHFKNDLYPLDETSSNDYPKKEPPKDESSHHKNGTEFDTNHIKTVRSRKISMPARYTQNMTSFQDSDNQNNNINERTPSRHSSLRLNGPKSSSRPLNRKFSGEILFTNNCENRKENKKMSLADAKSFHNSDGSIQKVPNTGCSKKTRNISVGELGRPSAEQRRVLMLSTREFNNFEAVDETEEDSSMRYRKVKEYKLKGKAKKIIEEEPDTMYDDFQPFRFVRRNAVCELNEDERAGLRAYLNFHLSKRNLNGIVTWQSFI